ncbi:MAG TPA: PAS domain-containing protein, partial [Myxococcaceae bacterium]
MSASPGGKDSLPLWLLSDARGIIGTCCPGSEQLLGLAPLGRTLVEVFGEEVGRQLLTGPEDTLEWSRPGAAGAMQPVLWRVERHPVAGGGLLVRAGLLKGAEEEIPIAWDRRIARGVSHAQGDIIEQQWGFMLSILDADPTLIFVKDRRGRFVFVNKAVADSYATTPDEIVLAHNAQVHHNAEELKAFDEVDQRVLQTLAPVRVEESVTRPDGTVTWYDTHKRPLRASNGETFVLGISVDITERRRIEGLLNEANQRLELAVGAGQLGLWDWDLAQQKVYLAPQWKAQLGYEDSELSNVVETWTGLMHPEDSARVLQSVGEVVEDASRGDRFVNEFRMRARDGSWRWIAGYGLVVRNE